MSKTTMRAWPIWFLIILFTFMRKSLMALDIFGLFTAKKSRLDEAKERDRRKRSELQHKRARGGHRGQDEADSFSKSESNTSNSQQSATRWYHLITSQTFYFICNSLFLNRTKASLRLDYEPLYSPEESMEISLDWYKNHLLL